MLPVVLKAGRRRGSSTWSCQTPTFSNLTRAQRQILDGQSGPQLTAALTASRLAEGMGTSTFIPPRKAGDPEVDAMSAIFAHDNGIKVLHETIQYLV